jgi:hypothetical protein
MHQKSKTSCPDQMGNKRLVTCLSVTYTLFCGNFLEKWKEKWLDSIKFTYDASYVMCRVWLILYFRSSDVIHNCIVQCINKFLLCDEYFLYCKTNYFSYNSLVILKIQS